MRGKISTIFGLLFMVVGLLCCSLELHTGAAPIPEINSLADNAKHLGYLCGMLHERIDRGALMKKGDKEIVEKNCKEFEKWRIK